MDALRGIAMLLGVVTHATLAYTTIPINGLLIESYDRHKIFDFLYLYLHLFRMPLFFIVAGFFARFLYFRIGEAAFIRHRVGRILIPFLVCLITIRPLTEAPFLFYKYVNSHHSISTYSALLYALRNCFNWMGTFHLWFLYYLSIYYVAMLVLIHFSKTTTGNFIMSFFVAPLKRYSLIHLGNVILLTLPIFVLLLPFKTAEVGIDTGSIFPRLNYCAFYGFFFFLGLLLHVQIKNLKKTGSNTWVGLIGGSMTAILFFVLKDHESIILFGQIRVFYLCKLLTAVSTILLTFGFLGLFMKYFSFESKRLRYISDSSYWVYLIHLAFVLTLQGLLSRYLFPAGIKFLIVLVVPTLISFVTYEWFVRYTIIGKCLHGPRKRKLKTTRRNKSTNFLGLSWTSE